MTIRFLESIRSAASKDQFSVTITENTWPTEWVEAISAQITRVEFNLTNRSVVLHVRQTKTGVVRDVIFHSLRPENNIDRLELRPSKGSTFWYVFYNGKITNHYSEFDLYKQNEDVIHELTLNFDYVKCMSPNLGATNIGDFENV